MKSRMNESEAILRAREGDAEGFAYLYDSHRKHVYSVCLRMLKNSADAEDLMQQAFLQVFRKIGTFRGESGFSTWLHRVTINAVLMHLRRKKPTEALAEEVDSAAANGEASGELGAEDVSLLGAVDRLNLRRALHKLPSAYRQFFLLHDVIGYKHAEFAEQKARRAMIGGAARRARTTSLRCQNRSESSRVGLHPHLKRLHRWIQPPALCDFQASARKVNA
jgi:RNA polymerase sigma-70 factor (ECF subfamily)